MKILYLHSSNQDKDHYNDYMSDLLLHGLREPQPNRGAPNLTGGVLILDRIIHFVGFHDLGCSCYMQLATGYFCLVVNTTCDEDQTRSLRSPPKKTYQGRYFN